MKKLTFLILSLITLSLGANAQLRVLSNGHVQIGNLNWLNQTPVYPPILPSVSTQATIGGALSPDTTATLSIMGPQNYGANGKIVFGGRNDVIIRESYANGIGTLILTGKGGIVLYSGSSNSRILTYNPTATLDNGQTYFSFTKPLRAPEFLTVSDIRCKKDIESLDSYGKGLSELSPVSFTLDILQDESDTTPAVMKQTAGDKNIDRHFGFIAQEVREIFPELVKEDEEGMLSVDYLGFIPLLVDAYKDLKAQVAEQQQIITSLTSGAKKTKGTAGIENLYGDDNVVLMQNRPNPFKTTTEIKCHLPQEVSEAFICIYDLNGRQQMRLDLRERGDVAVTISGSTLQPGMYIYSLITDGQEADSKRMILTE